MLSQKHEFRHRDPVVGGSYLSKKSGSIRTRFGYTAVFSNRESSAAILMSVPMKKLWIVQKAISTR
jgi:hypothetical protein